MYWLSTALFLLAAGWCSYRLYRARPLAGTIVAALITAGAYILMVTSRDLDMGGAAVALVLLDVTVVLLGTQAVLALLTHFDPPAGDDEEDDEGRGPGGGDGPPPVDRPGGGPDGLPLPVDWTGFDVVREGWEQHQPGRTPAVPQGAARDVRARQPEGPQRRGAGERLSRDGATLSGPPRDRDGHAP